MNVGDSGSRAASRTLGMNIKLSIASTASCAARSSCLDPFCRFLSSAKYPPFEPDFDTAELAEEAAWELADGVVEIESEVASGASVSPLACRLTEVVNCRGLMGRLEWKPRGAWQ